MKEVIGFVGGAIAITGIAAGSIAFLVASGVVITRFIDWFILCAETNGPFFAASIVAMFAIALVGVGGGLMWSTKS